MTPSRVEVESSVGGSNIAGVAYLLHLLFPALLLTDVLVSRFRGKVVLWPLGLETIVFGVCAVWLIAGLGWFFIHRNRPRFAERVSGPLLVIYVAYFLLIPLEIAATLSGITSPIPSLMQPGTKAVFKADPAIMPGISGVKHIEINRLGLRGPLPPKTGSAYKIVAIGGSTTICATLDDSEAWPYVLMQDLNAAQSVRPVWVGNAGRNAMNAVNHLVLMQWLPGIIQADLTIFLLGANDLEAAWAFEGRPTQRFLEKDALYKGSLPPGTRFRSEYPLFRRSKLYQLMREAGRNMRDRLVGPMTMRQADVVFFRKRRAETPVSPQPDLTIPLKEYRMRLLALGDRCRDLEMRCLFLTQPTLWRVGMNAEEQSLMWAGATGTNGGFGSPKGYVSVDDMARAMDAYNQVLLSVCQEAGLECYDLASHIPKNTTAFWDDMHFNEQGARTVAQTLTDYLVAKPPFR